jgi:hypothetical protein
MRVDLSGSEACVAKQFLHGTQISATIEQVRCCAVP